ncbi:MAG: long-chain fatty acid--CoA ligase, partial [Planctomycetota bacterium]|nr:long-chain fatty acid--CoA ligase [Planctomycetota bacterium]
METTVQHLPALLDAAAAAYAGKRFAVDSATRAELSFAGLQAASMSVAAALAGRCSIKPRQHVAVLMPNCLELLPAYFGILRAGCVAVPINARLKAEELQFILGDCEAQAVFVHPGTWRPAQEALKALHWQKPIIAACFDQPPPGTIPFPELLRPVAKSQELGAKSQEPIASSQSVAAIIYTSGTTGRPKGAMLSHGNILYNVSATKAGHGLRGDDIHLLVVPLFHVTGLNTIMPTALAQGGCLVVSSAIDPEDIVETVQEFRCTTFFGVPTTFYLLANLKDLQREKLSSLRLICYSGAPMSRLTIQRLRALFPSPEGRAGGPGVELHNFYGLTETTSCSTVLPDSEALARAESVGLPPPGLELCIM